ncbi:hypothetical protein [Saccharothrix hoggarensis]|uniref:Uncharacterized protein n=1 Tax=Saccharothrix hoggarensis TaxID=913853 RepID=A0ABW3QZP4_9PSEU
MKGALDRPSAPFARVSPAEAVEALGRLQERTGSKKVDLVVLRDPEGRDQLVKTFL